MKDNRGFADRFLSKFASRKLTVWGAGTAFLIAGMINGDQWLTLSIAYVGLQGFADIATNWKKAGRNSDY